MGWRPRAGRQCTLSPSSGARVKGYRRCSPQASRKLQEVPPDLRVLPVGDLLSADPQRFRELRLEMNESHSCMSQTVHRSRRLLESRSATDGCVEAQPRCTHCRRRTTTCANRSSSAQICRPSAPSRILVDFFHPQSLPSMSCRLSRTNMLVRTGRLAAPRRGRAGKNPGDKAQTPGLQPGV